MSATVGGRSVALATGGRDVYRQARPAREARGERIEEAALLRCDAWIPDPVVAAVARDATSFDYTPRAATQQAA
jgi:hypothetical protein